jgi:Protein of unknown function (DUF2808)
MPEHLTISVNLRYFTQDSLLLNILKDIDHFCWLFANIFMNFLFLLTACGLSLTGLLISANLTLAKNIVGNDIHVDQSRQFPETRWANADHYIRVHVPRNSATMSALSFQVPENLLFDASQVEAFDIKGQKTLAVVTEEIDSQVSPPVRIIQLDFSNAIASDSQIDLRIKNVKRILVSRPSIYSISAKLTGSAQWRYVGEAYFRSC